MSGLTRTIEIDDITPEELAALFLGMFGDEQARFFNAFKAITGTWSGAGWCQQCCSMSQHLDAAGKETIAKLAEWAANPYVSEQSQ